MKLRSFFLLIAVFLFTLSSCRDQLTGPNNTTASSDTVAYWTFDGNANDVSGNGHNGSLIGNYNFDGPNRFGESTKSITVIGGGEMVVARMPNFSDNDSYSVSFWVNVSPSGNFVSPDYGFGADSAYFGAQPMGCGLITSSHAVGADHWRLITLAVSAHNSATLYIDTVEEATKPYGSYTGTNDSMAMHLEFNQGGTTMSDTVRLDDAIVLHSCMTATEVAARFHEGGWYAGYLPSTIGGTTVPKPGSYFAMESFTDSEGVLYNSGGPYGGISYDTLKFVKNGLEMYGKSNVSQIGSGSNGGGYVSYESNGDFSIYNPEDSNSSPEINGWETYPFASQRTTSYTQDTIVGTDTTHRVETWSGAGFGTITLKGKQIPTELASIRIDFTSHDPGITHIDTGITKLVAFAPSLGWIVSSVDDPYSHPFNGDSSFVIDYQLK